LYSLVYTPTSVPYFIALLLGWITDIAGK
jgi:hypothetical protein